MRERAFEEILETFNPVSEAPGREPIRAGYPVTVWLPAEVKATYDTLQKLSRQTGRRFSEVLREATITFIAAAAKRAS